MTESASNGIGKKERGEGDVRGLRIKHAVVSRTLKEFDSYVAEEKEQQEKVEKMKGTEYLRQSEECLSETRMMIPDTERRLKAAAEDLLLVLKKQFGIQLKTLKSSWNNFFSAGKSEQSSVPSSSPSDISGNSSSCVSVSSSSSSDPILAEVKSSVMCLNLLSEKFPHWKLEDLKVFDCENEEEKEEEEI